MTYLFIGGGKGDERKDFLYCSYRQVYSKGVNTHGSDILVASSFGWGMGAQVGDLGWKKGEWHHLTITWKRDNNAYALALYCDGKKIDSIRNAALGKDIPTIGDDWTIRVGAEWLNSCYGTINAIKISSVALSAEEIAKNADVKPEADRFTLLLDTFNKVEKADKQNGVTVPEKGVQGKISGAFETVDGKFGPAVKLNAVEE